MVFKTLVARGASGGYYVFDIPVEATLDLKKAAKAAGEKSIEMLHLKELFPLTGYVHGGCSPIGMTELTGRDAATIHRLLGARMSEDGETTLFTKGENDPLECDAVILDECSMISYPITIDAQTLDLSSMMQLGQQSAQRKADHPLDGVYSNPIGIEMASSYTASLTENNLTAFKKYLDDPDSEIAQYLGENGAIYSYDLSYGVYTRDPDGALVDTDTVTFDAASLTPSMHHTCCPSPFRQPSTAVSVYITGTSGASSRI